MSRAKRPENTAETKHTYIGFIPYQLGDNSPDGKGTWVALYRYTRHTHHFKCVPIVKDPANLLIQRLNQCIDPDQSASKNYFLIHVRSLSIYEVNKDSLVEKTTPISNGSSKQWLLKIYKATFLSLNMPATQDANLADSSETAATKFSKGVNKLLFNLRLNTGKAPHGGSSSVNKGTKIEGEFSEAEMTPDCQTYFSTPAQ